MRSPMVITSNGFLSSRSRALKASKTAKAVPPVLFSPISFKSWEKLFSSAFPGSLVSSVIITVSTTVATLVVGVPAGYAFARGKFVGRWFLGGWLLFSRMMPPVIFIIPLFLFFNRLGLTNSYLGLIIAYAVSSVPLTIWTLKGYYETIPVDLEEAALIDGASRLTVFTKIMLPLSTPALAIAFLFSFMGGWSEYLVARVVLQKAAMYTWPLGIFTYAGQYTLAAGRFAAASMLLAVPSMALFLYSSKWLVSGLTLGGVKG